LADLIAVGEELLGLEKDERSIGVDVLVAGVFLVSEESADVVAVANKDLLVVRVGNVGLNPGDASGAGGAKIVGGEHGDGIARADGGADGLGGDVVEHVDELGEVGVHEGHARRLPGVGEVSTETLSKGLELGLASVLDPGDAVVDGGLTFGAEHGVVVMDELDAGAQEAADVIGGHLTVEDVEKLGSDDRDDSITVGSEGLGEESAGLLNESVDGILVETVNVAHGSVDSGGAEVAKDVVLGFTVENKGVLGGSDTGEGSEVESSLHGGI